MKTHGIKGELNCELDDVDLDLLDFIIIETEGINVPYFIEGIRPKHGDRYLIKLEGVDDETSASLLTSKKIGILKSKYDEITLDHEEEEGRVYLDDLKGYEIYDGNEKIGKISDIEDSTENVLFIVESLHGKTVYVPVAEDLIEEIDDENKIIKMNLPQGLTEL